MDVSNFLAFINKIEKQWAEGAMVIFKKFHAARQTDAYIQKCIYIETNANKAINGYCYHVGY